MPLEENTSSVEINKYIEDNINENLSIRIYSNDGDIPRFRIYSKSKDIESYINIINSNYNEDNQNKLSVSDIDILIEYLNTMTTIEISSIEVTNWNSLFYKWMANNGFYDFSEIEMPDYNLLKD